MSASFFGDGDGRTGGTYLALADIAAVLSAAAGSFSGVAGDPDVIDVTFTHGGPVDMSLAGDVLYLRLPRRA